MAVQILPRNRNLFTDGFRLAGATCWPITTYACPGWGPSPY